MVVFSLPSAKTSLISISLLMKCCRHNKALDPLYDDVDELNFRVRGANERGRRLLGK